FFFFFFQAEDGIRVRTVTGVQTCALPISTSESRGCGTMNSVVRMIPAVIVRAMEFMVPHPRDSDVGGLFQHSNLPSRTRCGGGRSEERRVGKECRSGGSPYEDEM